LNLLITIIRDDLTERQDSVLRDQIVEFLHRVKSNPDMGDQQYVKDKIFDFCRRQAFKEALEEAVELVSTDKFESVVSLMKNAVSVGMPSSTGHDFFEDIDARFIRVNRQACPTGIEQLDRKDILAGGLGRGEIGVITANTGVGKSHFLVSVGAEALRRGKNVLHYTFELSETAVGIRYDSNLCDIDSSDIIDRKEEVIKKYSEMDLGRLIIKEFPTGGATINTLRNHMEKLMLKSFAPSVIIVDYADIMRSTRQYDSLRHELKLIYEELRNMAMEMNIPIWTASQANRDSAKSDIVGLENMSEAYGKAMVADVVISISRKPMEKASGTGRLFVAKNRAGRDGLVFPIRLDTARSRVIAYGEEELTLNEAVSQDESTMKTLLKKKWNEINSHN
jgi:replicative DNA helicase